MTFDEFIRGVVEDSINAVTTYPCVGCGTVTKIHSYDFLAKHGGYESVELCFSCAGEGER